MRNLVKFIPAIVVLVFVLCSGWYLTAEYLTGGMRLMLEDGLEGSCQLFFLGVLMLWGGLLCMLANDDPSDFYSTIMLCLLSSPFVMLLLNGLYYFPDWSVPALVVALVLIGILRRYVQSAPVSAQLESVRCVGYYDSYGWGDSYGEHGGGGSDSSW